MLSIFLYKLHVTYYRYCKDQFYNDVPFRSHLELVWDEPQLGGLEHFSRLALRLEPIC